MNAAPVAMPTTASPRFFRYSADVLIHYQEEGAGPTPVVFLHGFAAALTTWHDLRGLFPHDRYRLIFLDLKGFGFSSKPRDAAYAVADQAAIVTAFLQALGVSGVVLVGHSLGGGVALLVTLGLQQQGKADLVKRLILLDSAAYPQRLPKLIRLLRMPFLNELLLLMVPTRLIVRYTLRKVFYNQDAITSERTARYVHCFSRRGIAHALIATARQLVPANFGQITAAYRTIALPVLLIWGRHDRIIRYRHGVVLHEEIAGSRLVVIEDCGHNPHEERPAECFAIIHEYLAEH